MREMGGEMASQSTWISRRHVIRGIAIAMASAMTSPLAAAESFDKPPVFENERHQFTLLSPQSKLPLTVLSTLDGHLSPLAPTPNELLLINIFATWCVICRTDLPKLDEFAATKPHRVKFAAVCVDRTSRQDIATFVEDVGVRHLPLYVDSQGRLASQDASSGSPLRLYGMPITYLVTPSGWIAGFISGPADWLSPQGQSLLAYYANA